MYSLALHGRRLVDLQKWRHHLSVSVRNASSFSNSFSSAPAADVSPRDSRKGQIFTVSYLVDSLGLTAKLAESISRKVSFVNKGNPDSVLNLLRRYGFTDSQISTIITNYPQLLMLDAKKSLGPKLQFLQSRGDSTSEFTEIVSKVPKILRKNGDKSISVYYDFVKHTLHSEKPDKSSKWEISCQSLPEGTEENKFRNVLVLRELGVPQRLLLPLLNSDAGPVYGKEKFKESVKKVTQMGINPTTSRFIQALGVLYQMSEKTIEEKVKIYQRLGCFTVRQIWAAFKTDLTFLTHSEKKIMDSLETFEGLGFSRSEFVKMVKRYPPCIAYSAETVKEKTEFLVKNMYWPRRALVLNPQVFGYSLEKRIVPRCKVIDALFSKGLLGGEGNELPPTMTSVLVCTDEKFLKRYVKKYDDKQLMAIFTGDHVS